MKDHLAEHYDRLAPRRDDFFHRNAYYYQLLFKQYAFFIPPHKRVLEVGCSTGELLNAVRPAYGAGIDISAEAIRIAREKFPHLHFEACALDDWSSDEPFDYIILSGLVGELDDIQAFFEGLKQWCHPGTRVIIEYYSYLWQCILRLGERCGWKIPQPEQNWLTYHDIANFLRLSGWETVRKARCTLFPKRIFFVSAFLNRFLARLPLFEALTLNHFVVARPRCEAVDARSVSVVIPAKNEKGNIEEAVRRIPSMAGQQEIIFVEGGSDDGTSQEIESVIRAYPDKSVRFIRQEGRGKADAVRLGFREARHDIFMILDADLTVPPEELTKFYEALLTNKGELINGCRLVYPMEPHAMRFLNRVANKFFSILFSWLLGQDVKDTLCGTKVVTRGHYENIMAQRSSFGEMDPFGDFDLLFGAAKLNLKITDLPVRYQARRYGSSQISRFRHGQLLLKMCGIACRSLKFI